ncbi:SMC-Scp complex subunit ScpB [Candidatus Poriferisocius sp.]|uniref:SMC-Scp complex subunit ScpB n=1 Tax=Candidatus Poriferisocius sp. TaxID=3101276 RepID=UPI003B52EFDD
MRDERREARRAVEAMVMVAEEPVAPGLMAQLIEIPSAEVEAICAELADEYRAEGRGFELVRAAGGYRYRSHPDAESYVKRFVVSGQSARLSSAALETLAIVAYKQPLSRAQVSAIRGVNAEGAMRTLEQRGLIYEAGRDPGPGTARLFATTPAFLERLGLDSLRDLPPLVDFVPGPEVIEALETSLMADSRPSPASGGNGDEVGSGG